MLALALAAGPMASHAPRTGDRIYLFDPPDTFPASAPFWVGHGHCMSPGEPIVPAVNYGTRFELLVDGVGEPARLDLHLGIGDDELGCSVFKLYVSNFRAGLSVGDHRFVGRWYESGALVMEVDATITFE